MSDHLVRLLAFFGKEFNEIRRQPQLWLSLLLGPILILVMVGTGYRGERAPLRIGLIVPDSIRDDPQLEDAVALIKRNFDVVELAENPDNKAAALEAITADVIEEIPADYAEQLEAGQTVDITFTYDVIEPQLEQYIRYAAFRQVDEVNNQLLISGVETAQSDAQAAIDDLNAAQRAITGLEDAADQTEVDDTLELIRRARAGVALLQTTALVSSEEDQQQAEELIDELTLLEEDLMAAEESVTGGRLDAISSDIDAFSSQLRDVGSRSPSSIVAPFRPVHNNLSGGTLSLVTFFAPSVAAFVLQHIGVTLGSLSLVRERMRGTREFYAASPMSIMQVLVGKYLAYMLFLVVIAVGLMLVLVYMMGVPFEGNIWALVGMMLLFILASVGYGFFISVVSRSDIQAVQFAMLTLLLAVFFSGFMLPLAYYTGPVRYAGYILPVTHAIEGMQAIMLRGELPSPMTWVYLSAMAVLSFAGVSLLWNRQN